MKITASVTRSLHQYSGLCYLYLPIFLYVESPLLLENKNWLLWLSFSTNQTTGHCSMVSITILFQATVQCYILRYYSSVRILFNIIKKRHTLRIAYTQEWTNSFLGIRLFGYAILLAHPIEHAKNDWSKSKCTSDQDRIRNIAFLIYHLNRTCSFHFKCVSISINSFCNEAFAYAPQRIILILQDASV